jgi:hypothetical protein
MKIAVVALVVILTALPVIALADTYDSTTIGAAHGFMGVIDSTCHRHSLNVTFDEGQKWGATPTNIRVTSSFANGLETPSSIQRRSGKNYLVSCRSEQKAFATYTDGLFTDWSDGNDMGSFTIRSPSGATRDFFFQEGPTNPLRINGKHDTIYCVDASRMPCDDLKAFFAIGKTRVRVSYKLVDSPDGPSTVPTNITMIH